MKKIKRLIGAKRRKRLVSNKFLGLRELKYRNKITRVGNRICRSKNEAARYQVLLVRERLGEISDLKFQPKYVFVINGIKLWTYAADFSYYDHILKKHVVEDVKGFKTQAYKRNKKMMLALFGIEIVET